MGAIAQMGLQLGANVANAAAGGVMGAIFGKGQDRRARKQYEKMQKIEIAGQREMTAYNMQKQLELWEKTGYGAQMRQMKEAGLNPGLMYGMGGGGGQTASIATGNVSGGPGVHTGGEATQGMGMMLGAQNIAAQNELIKAQTKLTNAQAEKTAGVDTTLAETTIEQIKQNVQSDKAKQALTEVQTDIQRLDLDFQRKTYDSRVDTIDYLSQQAMYGVGKAEQEWGALREQRPYLLAEIYAKSLGAALQNELTKAQTDKTQSDITVNKAQIKKWGQEIANQITGLDIQERQLRLNAWTEKMKQENPGLWNVLGGAAKRLVDQFDEWEREIFGGNVIKPKNVEQPNLNK